jgi:hypothetical protein
MSSAVETATEIRPFAEDLFTTQVRAAFRSLR